MWNELALAMKSDAYIWFMGGLGFIGLVILFERFFTLQFRFNINFDRFLMNLKKAVKSEDFDRAVNLCRSGPKTSLPHISLRALEAAEADPASVRGTIDEETVSFLPQIDRRINLIPAFATLILLVGVLGTVDHLWTAFHSIGVLDTTQKQAAVGRGIAGSLVHTTAGLVICMFLLMGHQFLRGIAIRLTEKIQLGVTVLHNLLVPQDYAYVPAGIPMDSMPAAAPAPAAAAPAQTFAESETETVEEVATEEESADDSAFEDASVEDIKDEEEII